MSRGISALIFGLFAGVALAFLVEFLDDSITSHEDAERAAYGLATLGHAPALAGWKKKSDSVVVSLSAPTSPGAEAYRSLRTALQFVTAERSLRVVQVTSPGTSEGKTTTVANLAVAFARVGSRVCAVDGDLRRPRIHTFFGGTSEPGLTNIAIGELPLSQALQTSEPAHLSFLASGPSPEDPSELLGSTRMTGVLASLVRQFDIVLVDSPPILPVTDAAVLARLVDGVVVVVDNRRTKKRALTRAIEILRQVDAPVLGLVVNRGDDESKYGYSYRYDVSSDAGKPAPALKAQEDKKQRRGSPAPRSGRGAPSTPKTEEQAPV